MEARRFDALTRAFSTTSRRGVLAVVTAALAPLAAGSPLQAKKKKKKKCKVKCGGKVCGPSNCKGKTCGSCPAGKRCNAKGECVCDPQCRGKDCGDDGCGGNCGRCHGNSQCNANGKCAGCLSADDCDSGQVCTEQQVCCTTNCDGRYCSPDGCGGTCACAPGSSCQNGKCVCAQPGQVVCNGNCVTAECCVGGVTPGVRCGQRCVPLPGPDLFCCTNGLECSTNDDCCGFDTAQGTVCQGNTCCQPLGGPCGGAASTCCSGYCFQGECTECPGGGCCTDNEPGCPEGKQCCGTTCIANDACCTNGSQGCGQGKKCCGGVCIASDVCCTDGVPGECPTNRPHCFDGECVQCGPAPGPVCEFKPCTQQFATCIDGTCFYSPGHEGDQCLIESSQTNGVCCAGACRQCCGGNATNCPTPPLCMVKACNNNQCIPVPVSTPGPQRTCRLCCTNGDCCDAIPNTICGGSGRCCRASGESPGAFGPSICCSNNLNALGNCA